MDEQAKGPPMTYRVHQAMDSETGKPFAWIQRRFLLWWWKDHYPADNQRRFAMSEFIRLVQEAEKMLMLYEESKNDNAKALAHIENKRKGVSDAYKGPRTKREDAIPDFTKEFEQLKKQFKAGFKPNPKSRLGTPEHAPRSRYVPHDSLPHLHVDGTDYDHTIGYNPNRNRQNQQGNRKSQSKQPKRVVPLDEQES